LAAILVSTNTVDISNSLLVSRYAKFSLPAVELEVDHVALVKVALVLGEGDCTLAMGGGKVLLLVPVAKDELTLADGIFVDLLIADMRYWLPFQLLVCIQFTSSTQGTCLGI